MLARTHRLLPLLLLAMPACSDLPTTDTGTLTPSFKPGPTGPAYTLLTADFPAGASTSIATSVNRAHTVVVTTDERLGSSQHAYLWAAGTGTTALVRLPEFPGAVQSWASRITDNGIVAGNADGRPVLWMPNGTGFDITTLNDNGTVYDGRANDVRDDGVAVGKVYLDIYHDKMDPALWSSPGTMTLLPMPAGGRWTHGEASAINAQGDIAGWFMEIPAPPGPSYYQWGGVWLKDGDGWVPMVVTSGPALAIADRTPDGRVSISVSDGDRYIFWKDGTGAWVRDSVVLPGPGFGMTPAGDITGYVPKARTSSGGIPYLLTIGGTQISLPLPKGGTAGLGQGLSADLWVAGAVDRRAAAWKPR